MTELRFPSFEMSQYIFSKRDIFEKLIKLSEVGKMTFDELVEDVSISPKTFIDKLLQLNIVAKSKSEATGLTKTIARASSTYTLTDVSQNVIDLCHKSASVKDAGPIRADFSTNDLIRFRKHLEIFYYGDRYNNRQEIIDAYEFIIADGHSNFYKRSLEKLIQTQRDVRSSGERMYTIQNSGELQEEKETVDSIKSDYIQMGLEITDEIAMSEIQYTDLLEKLINADFDFYAERAQIIKKNIRETHREEIQKFKDSIVEFAKEVLVKSLNRSYGYELRKIDALLEANVGNLNDYAKNFETRKDFLALAEKINNTPDLINVDVECRQRLGFTDGFKHLSHVENRLEFNGKHATVYLRGATPEPKPKAKIDKLVMKLSSLESIRNLNQAELDARRRYQTILDMGPDVNRQYSYDDYQLIRKILCDPNNVGHNIKPSITITELDDFNTTIVTELNDNQIQTLIINNLKMEIHPDDKNLQHIRELEETLARTDAEIADIRRAQSEQLNSQDSQQGESSD